MRAGGRDHAPALRRRDREAGSDRPQLLDGRADGAGDAGGGLRARGHQLLPHAFAARSVGDLVEARHELVALRGQELELLLDPHAEAGAAPERAPPARDPSGRDDACYRRRRFATSATNRRSAAAVTGSTGRVKDITASTPTPRPRARRQ